jgi:hypothetical protein
MSEYLYLIKCKEAYKIGVATDVRSRIASLQTGNPYKLELADCFQFTNAEFVERALHQKYNDLRMLGEWFEIPNEMIGEFGEICRMLGGVRVAVSNGVSQDEIEEAEEIQKEVFDNLDKWDYAAMFADGWRMERTTNGRHVGEGSRYWCWRKGNASKGKKYIYGGVLSELPYPIEEMRRVYTPNALVEGASNAE